ncbi:hypothetical protein [Nocardia sp. NPDC051463]|uniref:hypothetical protein n=1 Tax=Nocardia sp. NPDC051463 TaxID=3154845 RepID=UPI00344B07F7
MAAAPTWGNPPSRQGDPMPDLIHPVTGLRALGMGKRGPIWPILGGSEDNPPADPPVDDAPAGETPASGKGFPQGVPVADMTAEEQAAYFKHYARKHEGAVKAYNGVTPKQVAEMADRIKALETEKLTDSEKAVETAKAEAAEAARAAAEADWKPRLLTSELKAVAGTILDKEQLASFMEIAAVEKFAKDDGTIDEDKVMGHLTAIYGQPRQFGAGLPQHLNWGQHGTPPPAPSGVAMGKAEAAKRFGTNKTNL